MSFDALPMLEEIRSALSGFVVSSNRLIPIEPASEEEKKRFMSYVTVDEKTECWNFVTKHKTPNFNTWRRKKRKKWPPHVYAWHYLKGEMERPDCIDHFKCHNGHCVNPDHLRAATYSQNNRNRRPKKNGTSKFLGVCWCKKNKNWIARIQVNGKNIRLGSFDDEEEAARAVDRALIERDGPDALTNEKMGLYKKSLKEKLEERRK